ncbi:hypothetical protein GHO25_12730 [Pseudomonas sp. FSL R10-1350]|uniref:RHS repeat-associated core domain-containing protein n=1 Tax=Pseudomonas sp. FSL R10-1350 TaxID=2662197 RepID=UPI001295DBA0|nr:RHS repeat-associated core domain-containing protein [Pseudomonas sp. FSL R10-1350]MQU63994.1 hypothetical protein [Pseudomonas sp. FSL R10-1350]
MPNLLCYYQYDPLDRLIGSNQNKHSNRQYFYQENRLTLHLHNKVLTSIFRYGNLPLAQKNTSQHTTDLFINDNHNSTLHTTSPDISRTFSYTCHGYNTHLTNSNCLLEFSGEHRDFFTQHYILGNGHRAYSPVLMRFNTPDNLSPFDKGGLNAYAYCLNDPINRSDPSGAASLLDRVLRYLPIFRRNRTPIQYKAIGATRIKKTSSLIDHDADPFYDIAADVILKGNLALKRTTITVPKTADDLSILNQPNTTHKYVLNKNNDLAIASYPKGDPAIAPSHPSITRYISNKLGLNNDVISAGYIVNTSNGYMVTNHSGHYRPKAKHTSLTTLKLKSLGAQAFSKSFDLAQEIKVVRGA